ncbi:MAG: hypothetical protein KAU50_04455 [Candidatus Marinimicrobia bacterium]|nr:hypothetical protein [Candidatus Neomarinimicrobiota bacterium]
MKQTINFSQFYDGFEIRRKNFSYWGLKALFDYFEQYEEDTKEEIEFDPIGICCEYTEYENIEAFREDYSKGIQEEYLTIEDVEEQTTVIKIDDDKFIIQRF